MPGLGRILPLLFVLAACHGVPEPIALTEPPVSVARDTPNGRAEVVVMRAGIRGWAHSFGLYVNDMHVGDLHTGDFVRVDVPPGFVEMYVDAELRSEARFPVEADRSYYFQAHVWQGWWMPRSQLEVIEPSQGLEWRKDFADKTFPEPKPAPFDLEFLAEPTEGKS